MECGKSDSSWIYVNEQSAQILEADTCKMNNKPPGVVIKLDCATGLQTARILASYQIPVYGIADNPKHFGCRTNTCEQILTADTSSYELVETLISLGSKLQRKSVLFPCSDESAHVISLNRDNLEQWFCFVMPNHDTKELFSNKMNFYKFAERNSLPIPRTFFPKQESDLADMTDKMEFPCVIKPAVKSPVWFKHFQTKAIRVDTAQELHDVFPSVLSATDDPIVQQWIEGKDSNLKSCTFYYNRNCDPLISFTSRKIRQWPPVFGEICVGEEIRDEKVRQHASTLLDGIGFRGVGSLELKVNEADGRLYMIEANVSRLPLRFGLLEAGGVELIRTMYLDALGIEDKTSTQQLYTNAKLILLLRDIRASILYYRMGELTLGEWLLSFRGKKTFAIFSFRDPMPFLIDTYIFMKNIFMSNSLTGLLKTSAVRFKQLVLNSIKPNRMPD